MYKRRGCPSVRRSGSSRTIVAHVVLNVLPCQLLLLLPKQLLSLPHSPRCAERLFSIMNGRAVEATSRIEFRVVRQGVKQGRLLHRMPVESATRPFSDQRLGNRQDEASLRLQEKVKKRKRKSPSLRGELYSSNGDAVHSRFNSRYFGR